MKLRPYPEYKDSGVEWLGSTPSHWSVFPLRFMASDSNSLFIDGDWVESKDLSDSGIRYLTTGNVGEGVYKEQGSGYISDEKFKELNCTEVLPGDVLISRLNLPIARACLAPDLGERVISSVDIVVFRPDASFNRNFIIYLLSSKEHFENTENLARGTTMQRISRSSLGRVRFLLPSYEEQSTIASFLDRETSKLDNLIAKQEHLIELLQEKRQAIISHAVTKGLNPDAKMKDSGVEWLGMMPEHWKAIPTKQIFHLVVDPADDDNDFELLSIYTDIGVRPRKDLEAKGNKATTTDGYFRVKKNDFIVNKLLAWMGAIGLSAYDGVTSPAYDVLRAHRKIDPRFYDYLFRCGAMFIEFKKYSRGIMDMRLRLYFEEFGQLHLPYPSADEQTGISNYLDKETSKIDILIGKAKRSIELAKEHRTALISAAVTGKIDVREAA